MRNGERGTGNRERLARRFPVPGSPFPHYSGPAADDPRPLYSSRMRRLLPLGLLVACSSSSTSRPAPANGDAGAAGPPTATAAEMAPTSGAPGEPGPIPVAECPIAPVDSEPLE